jgi:exodeoxyribonuclease-3
MGGSISMQKVKVISLNVNGIRAAKKKGLFQWIVSQNPDYVCIQEVRAQEKDLELSYFNIDLVDLPLGGTYFFSKKPGYAGVAIFSKKKPTNIVAGINVTEFDDEGRVLRIDFDNFYDSAPRFSLISIYFPSGSASEIRQESKYRFLSDLKKTLRSWSEERTLSGRQFLICGDWNIAHKEIDLKNYKQNKKNSGFLPEERKWLSDALDEGWKDVFRQIWPEDVEFTWWSQRGRARENNVGWRIDYQIATVELASSCKNIWVEKEPKLSDHAPLIALYDL